MTSRIAIFPGSFDPITLGHESIVKRALPLFEKIIIAIGENSNKKNQFPLDQRKSWIEKVFSGVGKIEVTTYSGLTIDLCKKEKASFILRGLRTSADFEFERVIAQMNRSMSPDIETIFLLSLPEYSAIASSVIRDILRNQGDVSQFVPTAISTELK